MKQTQIDRLNGRLASTFGRNPHGEPNYKWAHAAELNYLFENGTKEEQTPAGLFVIRTTWEKHSFVETYGMVWLLVKWEPPQLEYDEWWDQFGGDIPFPAKGQYCPIESTVLPEGQVPDEDLNQYAIRKLYEHLGMKYRDHLDAAKSTIAKVQQQEADEVSDLVDEAVPAFHNIPGAREHVSFPTPTRTGGVSCQK